MSDNELCRLIAKTWVENGGDLDGFEWCLSKLREAIKEAEEDKK